MPNYRKFIFGNDEIYHVFNRGVEKRPTFTDKRELIRAAETFAYYRFINIPFKFSQFLKLEQEKRSLTFENITKSPLHIEILAYCFMPNHFHFLLRQVNKNGVSKFMANFTNSYTKYFNTKHDRIGPLFQGMFKAVRIEDDEQLLHISRYIHLNPVSSLIIEAKDLQTHEWSSYPDYLSTEPSNMLDKNTVLNFFSEKNSYQQFVLDQANYARTLEQIKHLIFD